MTEKAKVKAAKGPGDPCPQCGAELVEPRNYTPRPSRGNPDPQPEPVGVARCAECGYVLSEPVKDEPAPSARR